MLVPTRGRPLNAARLQAACAELNRAKTLVIFGVDSDDPKLNAYREVGIIEVVKPAGPGMVGALNQLAERYSDQAPAIGFMGDDHCPRTIGWDQHLCTAIDQMGGGIAYGNDLLQGASLPTAVVMDSRIVRELRCMAPPCLRHLYVDNVWLEWGRGINKLAYLQDVIIEHLHPSIGKSSQDEHYELVNSENAFSRDRNAFEDYAKNQLPLDIALLEARA